MRLFGFIILISFCLYSNPSKAQLDIEEYGEYVLQWSYIHFGTGQYHYETSRQFVLSDSLNYIGSQKMYFVYSDYEMIEFNSQFYDSFLIYSDSTRNQIRIVRDDY